MRAFRWWVLACIGALGTAFAQDVRVPQAWFDEARSRVPTAPCVETRAEPKIDGELGEWAELPNLPLGLPFQAGFDRFWTGRGDCSARVWLAHDRSYLYLAAQVTDDRLVVMPKNDARRGDQVRLFLAANATGEGGKAVFLIPQRGGDAARALDGESLETLDAAQLAYKQVDRGYRFELRLPWTLVPGGQPKTGELRGVAVQVCDWDIDDLGDASLTFPAPLDPAIARPKPPGAPEAPGWQPPAREVPKPDQWAPLAICGPLTDTECLAYLPALLPIGCEKGFYDKNENVRIFGASGLPAAAAARLDLWGAPPDGTPVLFVRDDGWSDGAVGGPSWTWQTPEDFKQSWLLIAAVHDPFDDAANAGARSYGRLGSLPGVFDEHLARLKALKEKMMAAAVAPGSDTKRRRYLGSVLINLEERQAGNETWRNWLSPEDVERLQKDVAEISDLADKALAGADPYAGKKGQFLRGYVSEIDDTLQHYAVGIPDNWNPGDHFPLILSMHGYGFGQFQGSPAPREDGIIYISPYGRGNGDYKLWCEEDLKTVVAAMLEDYGCDPDRVYATGGSMGGTGSWQIATIAPDLFAAIGPTMGNTNQRVWEQVWGWGQRETTFMTPFRQWLEATTSSFTYAENLRHVPVYCVHGDADDIVPVDHSRTMVRRLRGLGYDVTYEEQSGVGHGGFAMGTEKRQRTFMLTKTRDLWPKHVTWKTSWPRYAGAYWARIERMERMGRDSVLDADVDGQTVRVSAYNITRFTLNLRDPLLDVQRPVKILVNGQLALDGNVPAGGLVRIGLDQGRWGPADVPRTLEKNANVGGPVEHAFMSRFLLVVGTGGDRRTNEVNRRMADQFAEKWKRWGRGQRARVKLDWEVDDRDIAESNLICYGGPDSNRITAKVNDRLPIRIEGDTVVAGREVFRGTDLGVKLCYPNPLNPDRYLCVFAGTSWRATWDINGRFGNFFDWGVFDDRNWYDFNVFDDRTQSPETHVLVGFFDADWKLDNAVVFHGDPRLRAQAQPRRAPDPLLAAPTAPTVYLSELPPRSVRMEKGVLGYDQSFGGRKIQLGPLTFDRGLGIHPEAEVVYDLAGRYDQFEAWVGIDLEGADSVSSARESAERVAFEVWGDGKLLADSGEMRWNTRPKHFVVRIGGVKELRLNARALDGRKWLFGDSAWGLAKVTRAAGRAEQPSPPPPAAPERLVLDGRWQLDDFPVGTGVPNGAADDRPELPERGMDVPGSVAAALVANRELPDPYLNDNLTQFGVLDEREWWLYRRFELPAAWAGRGLRLRLDGLTQSADVWLNGTPLGRSLTPFAALEVEAAGAAKPGASNLLAVRLTSGPAEWSGVNYWSAPGRDKTLGFGVGWGDDAGGRAVPLGIHGGVTLTATGPVTLGAPLVSARLSGTLAAGAAASAPGQVTVQVPLTASGKSEQTITVRGVIPPPSGEGASVEVAQTVVLHPGENQHATLRLDLPEARPWWPQAELAGSRTVYRVVVSVEAGGQVSDVREAAFGFRELSLAGGRLLLNGQPLALRIARWRPVDRLMRHQRGLSEAMLRQVIDSGFNTLRVEAGAEAAFPELWRRCDELGLLVLCELPLTGEIGRTPEADVTAATEGLATALRNHPSRLGYVLGWDLADNADATNRLDLASERLTRVDPEALVVAPVKAAAGPAIWTWTAVSPPREGVAMPVQQIVLPEAPPGDLAFFDRHDLPAEASATPWPLTEWWRQRGGNERTLQAALDWLGPSPGEDDLGDRLSRWQAESARRQVTQALASGRTLYVDQFNDTWPRVGPGLVDAAGRPRPARDVVRRLSATRAVLAQTDETVITPGQTLNLHILAPGAVRGTGDAPAVVRTRVQSADGVVSQEQSFDLPAEPSRKPLGELSWKPPAGTPAGPYFAVTELLGSDLEADVVPLGLRREPAGELLRVGVAGEESPTLPGVVLQRDGAAAWLAAGNVGMDVADDLAKSVEAGAGVVFDGLPSLPYGNPLQEALGVKPVDSFETRLTPVGRPEVRVPQHPALLGLGDGVLPDGWSGGFYDLDPAAEALVRYGPGRPMLVESRYGKGRVLVLLTSAGYRRRLGAWDGWPRFLTGLLAYAGKLSYGDTRKLLTLPDDNPLAGLDSLPTQHVALWGVDGTMQVTPGQAAVKEFRVHNDGNVLVPQVLLSATGLPQDLTARLSATAFALRPGETRTLTLTVEAWRRMKWSGKLVVALSGWGAQAASGEIRVEAGW